MELFKVSDTNPNDACGGGGCACSEAKCLDCVGPFVVFPAQEMASNLSPYLVIGANCLRKATAALDGEVLAAGEKNPEPAEAEVEL